jgi:hypothetical protein
MTGACTSGFRNGSKPSALMSSISAAQLRM